MASLIETEELLSKLSLEKPKVNKKNLTAFWGISIDKDIIIQHELIKKYLSENPELVVITKPIHSTLLYVGKKPDNPDELKYIPLEKKKCTLIIDSFGYSKEALALKVEKITYDDESGLIKDVPSHAILQHITLALKEGIPAKDSVKSFSEGVIIKFDSSLIMSGEIKRYLY
mgnify:CR=1 FL=1|jgi:hypothetical protein